MTHDKIGRAGYQAIKKVEQAVLAHGYAMFVWGGPEKRDLAMAAVLTAVNERVSVAVAERDKEIAELKARLNWTSPGNVDLAKSCAQVQIGSSDAQGQRDGAWPLDAQRLAENV